MAKIHEEHIVIKISRLVGDNDSPSPLVTSEINEAVVALAQEVLIELLGSHVVIESANTN